MAQLEAFSVFRFSPKPGEDDDLEKSSVDLISCNINEKLFDLLISQRRDLLFIDFRQLYLLARVLCNQFILHRLFKNSAQNDGSLSLLKNL